MPVMQQHATRPIFTDQTEVRVERRHPVVPGRVEAARHFGELDRLRARDVDREQPTVDVGRLLKGGQVLAAIIAVNAQSGIEVNTRRMFQEAGKAGLGRMIVINKMDHENLEPDVLLATVRGLLGETASTR